MLNCFTNILEVAAGEIELYFKFISLNFINFLIIYFFSLQCFLTYLHPEWSKNLLRQVRLLHLFWPVCARCRW